MEISSAVLLLGVFIILYTTLLQIFTILFQLTGLTKEKALTQVVSLLTNSGYTTEESEIIMNGKKRRLLARVTMLTGYSFAVTIISILANIFFTLNQAELDHTILSAFTVGGVLIIFYLITRITWVRYQFDKCIEKIGIRVMFGKGSNVLILVDLVKENAIVEAMIDYVPSILMDKTLAESNLKGTYNIQVLCITRNEETLEQITADTKFERGDRVLLFGDYRQIKHVFHTVDSATQEPY